MKRGYFGIGIYMGKTTSNIGTLWRSANILGAGFIFTIGRRYKKQCSDTMKTPRHIPLYTYENADDFFNHVPYDCPVVAVELAENSVPLDAYQHRERCIYLLGACPEAEGGIRMCFIDKYGEWYVDRYNAINEGWHVTHWMPLPELPTSFVSRYEA